MEQLPVIQIIRREARLRKITVSVVSRSLGLSYTSARSLLRRPTMQVQRLAELSEIFQYNFFRELAQQLPYAEPDCTDNAELDRAKQEIEALQKRVFELEVENRTLKEAFRGALGR